MAGAVTGGSTGARARAGTLLSVAAMVLWGAAYVPSSWLVDAWSPLVAAGARLAVAGAAILGALALLGRSLRPGVGVGVIVWLALTQSVLFYGATFWGIAHAGAGPAAVLANTDPLFVAALASVFLGERLAPLQWLGLGVGLIGAAVVVWDGPLWPVRLSGVALLVVGGALAWGVGTVVATRSVRGSADPVALAGWQLALGGVALGVAGLVIDPAGLRSSGLRELILVAGLAAAGSAAPAALFYLALVRAPATEVSAWFFLIPVLGVLSAWPLLGEEPSPRLLVGLVGVSAGLWLVLARPGVRQGPLVDSGAPP